MTTFQNKTPAERIASLRYSFNNINRIMRSVRREPRDTDLLKFAEEQAERDLVALELWAAEQPRE